MNPNDWGHLKQIFLAAAELLPDARSRFLDDACAESPRLRSEAEVLLAADAASGWMLTGHGAVAATDAAPPERIGEYLITGVLGRGGMGVVYRGEHVDGGHVVALKTARMACPQLVAGIR